MGRSQRHMLWEQGATADGEIHAQGVVAPGIAMQVDPVALNVLKPGAPLYNTGLELQDPPDDDEAGVEVPVGAPGGPLSGSTLTGAIPEELVPGPEPTPAPVLTSLNPATAVLNDPDVTMHCIGSGFTPESVIYFAGQPEPIVFVSEGDISTVITLSLPWGAVTVPVYVENTDAQRSATLDFTFTEAAAAPETAPESTPLGPFTIVRVEDHADGLLVVLADGDVHVGDTVLIEATGNTSVNGSYTVLSATSPTEIVVDNTYELLALIENKGRLTITDQV